MKLIIPVTKLAYKKYRPKGVISFPF